MRNANCKQIPFSERALNILGFSALVFGLLLVYSAPEVAQAQYYLGPAATAAAGAGRASVSPIDSPFLNPAAVAHLNKYYIGASFFSDPDNQADRQRAWGVHVSDNNPESLVAGGLAYISNHREVVGVGGVDEQDIHLALAGHLYPQVTFGIAGDHLIQDSIVTRRLTSNNLSVGLIYTPSPNWGIAAVGYNLLKPNPDAPQAIRAEDSYAIGVNYLYDTFLRVKADVVKQVSDNPNNRLAYMGGFETFLIPQLAVRLGYQRNELSDQKIYAGGLGFEGPKFSLDYTAQVIDGQGGARHAVDLWASF